MKKVEKIISETKIIPLIDNSDLEISKMLCNSIVKSGCKIIEFGIRHENSLTNFLKLKKFVETEFDEVFLGSGSITDLDTAKRIIDIETDFVIGPGFNSLVNNECINSNKLYIPGCATSTECINAKILGLNLIKIFPANLLGGPDYLKTIKASMPWLRVIPAGGILANPRNVNNWYKAGATAVTLGSSLFTKELIKESNYIQIERTLSDILEKREF